MQDLRAVLEAVLGDRVRREVLAEAEREAEQVLQRVAVLVASEAPEGGMLALGAEGQRGGLDLRGEPLRPGRGRQPPAPARRRGHLPVARTESTSSHQSTSSPPTRSGSSSSSRKPPFSFSGPWHPRQADSSSGSISRRNDSRSVVRSAGRWGPVAPTLYWDRRAPSRRRAPKSGRSDPASRGIPRPPPRVRAPSAKVQRSAGEGRGVGRVSNEWSSVAGSFRRRDSGVQGPSGGAREKVARPREAQGAEGSTPCVLGGNRPRTQRAMAAPSEPPVSGYQTSQGQPWPSRARVEANPRLTWNPGASRDTPSLVRTAAPAAPSCLLFPRPFPNP